jgi:hypothetical protein
MEVLLAKMTSSKDAATRYECMKALNTGLKEFETDRRAVTEHGRRVLARGEHRARVRETPFAA